MTPIKILVAEDDPNIRMGLVDTLESEGYAVVEAADGEAAVRLFETEDIGLLLLDIMMPKKSGYDVCREIRARDRRVPVIMLTAKGEEIDTVVGLQLGADDYITKPFGVHELLARISAVLRRSVGSGTDGDPSVPETRVTFGRLAVDLKRYTLEKEGIEIALSDREIRLIRLFHSRPGEVLSRDFILNQVWGIDYLGTTRTLDQHIANLRKKVEPTPSNPEIITTVHGIGYRYSP